MEIAIAIISPFVECFVNPVKKQLGYLISCTKYVSEIGTRMTKLDHIRNDVEEKVMTNTINNRQIPTNVSSWMEEVKTIKAEVDDIEADVSIHSDVNNCFNLKMRYKVGKKAYNTLGNIDRLIRENPGIEWTGLPIPLGKVDSKKESAFASSADYNDFKSRELVFENALKVLQSDHNTHMIALCGMPGVGKTSMMRQLKKTVAEKKMFNYIVTTTIGETTNPIVVQDAVADYILRTPLKEKTKDARADKLCNAFNKLSEDSKKILIILDDVWKLVDLNDIGLNPLPNQGVGFKFLLTSRNQDVCKKMGVESNSIFQVGVLESLEAKSFFLQLVNISDADHELLQIGEQIVRKCGGLPIAIKTIAGALKDKRNDVWKDALSRLRHDNLDKNLLEIFKMSYNNLEEEETKAIFRLCGLFPEDFNIRREDLTRYGWGLRLFNKVDKLSEARYRLNTCIEQLICANMLIESDYVGCVKMHDLWRAYVASIDNHCNISEWPTEDTSEFCTRISLTCTGMCEFPREFKYPNLLLLALMYGDKSHRFSEDFYGRMEKLQVISYESMQYPLLPGSLKCSTNLRTLCLRSCLLMDELSPIGDLKNLEILSFAHCSIRKLPSKIWILKKLKLLDLTGCVDLQIDDGILEKLDHLEELYMSVSDGRAIRFTDTSYKELAMLSRKLFALEVDFFKNKVELENGFFKNLERFRISMGCFLKETEGNDVYSFENTLMLDINKGEILESKINELFEKTKVLHLKVNNMNHLAEVLVQSLYPPPHSFYNLRVLKVSKCESLRYLFTLPIVSGLSKLEDLRISKCDVMEELIHVETTGAGEIEFRSLKFLSLGRLPNLMSLCRNADVIKLPELVELKLEGLPNFTSIYPKNKSTSFVSSNVSAIMKPFLKKEVVIPNLEKLEILNMENLMEIWPCQFSGSEEVSFCRLKEIRVDGCDRLINLFPTNPMLWLHHLEELYVKHCGSVEAIFDLNLEHVRELEEESSNLRRIRVSNLGKLREVWRMNNVNISQPIIRGFEAVTSIEIKYCMSFRSIFTPTTAIFDLGATKFIYIRASGDSLQSVKTDESVESNASINTNTNGHQIDVSKGKMDHNIPIVAFTSHLIHLFLNLSSLSISNSNGVDVVFEIKSASSVIGEFRHNQLLPLLPQLEHLELIDMQRVSHVWKCNWNKFLIAQQQQLESSFQNLTRITLIGCGSIKYLFSPLMAKLLSNLKKLEISDCRGIEEIVSNRDDEKDEEMTTSTSTYTNTVFFPHLQKLSLNSLPSLTHIGSGARNTIPSNITTTSIHDQSQHAQVDVASWSLCQYSREIHIYKCRSLLNVIPSHALGQMKKLEVLRIISCESMTELFETEGVNNNGGASSTGDGEESGGNIPRMKNMTLLQLPNLKRLEIIGCDLLKHIFTFSTLESLEQLKELTINRCKEMQVIVKEEDRKHPTTSDVVVFPRLQSLKLEDLPNLKGFFLGMNDFYWPLLDKVTIDGCPQMMVFTSGHSKAPELKYIHTKIGKHKRHSYD